MIWPATVVEGLEDGQLPGALLDDARDPEQVLAALGGRHRAPRPLEGAPRGRHGAVDVLRSAGAQLREHLLGGRRDRRQRGPVGRGHPVAADEQVVVRADRDHVARLGRGRVLEARVGEGHG
jgi:hypothetical protein